MGGLMRGDRYKRTELKDAISESHLFYNRATVAFLLVFIGLIILVSRAFILQVVNHKNYSTLSDRNRISLIAEAPVRGIIYDRNGVILADNRSVYSLVLVPEKVKNMNATLMGLKALFHIDKDLIDDFRQRLRSTRRFTQKVLLNNISEVQRARFAVNKYRFPGVSIESRLVRYYPFAEKMVHFLGYVGRINDREIENLDAKNYRATLDIGKLGLEKFYEQKLHGLVGRREVETDAVGREIRTLDRTPPIPGDSLYLSIDSRLQLKAVEAMDGIKGALVAVDPETGKVLALVSNPSYDPNDFVLGIGVSAYKKLLESEDRPLFNRALRGQYPPGSTIKPMLALTALEQGVITEDYQLSDPGWYQLENDDHKYRDHKKYGHGMVNLYQAIVHSCDTYFYDVGYKLGIDRIHENMSHFGFGEMTDIDMGEEISALMPSREWKKQHRKMTWFPGETVITGIGQGFWTVTPLQLVNATAILANGGTRFKLSLVDAIKKGEQIIQLEPRLANEQVAFSQKNWLAVMKAMRGVVKEGTAARAFAGANFTSAGKTGTAQLVSVGQDEEYKVDNISEGNRDNAMYMGFAPFEKPTIAIVVVMENKGHGGAQAAPIARKVMESWFDFNAPTKVVTNE